MHPPRPTRAPRPLRPALLGLGFGWAAGCTPGPGADSASPGGTDAADGDRVPAAFDLDPRACVDPGARDALGAFSEWTSPVWETQHVEPIDEDNLESGGWGVAVEDFDGDGVLDLYLPHFDAHELWLGDGSGWNPADTALVFVDTPHASGAAPGDLDGDGDMDLMLAGGKRLALLNDGSGRFEATDWLPMASGGNFSTALGDVDQDGVLDVLVPLMGEPDGAASEADLPPGTPTVLGLGDGAGGFTAAPDALPADTNDGYPFQGSLLDMNGDGALDIYIANDHGSVVRSNRYWRNEGGSFVDASTAAGLDVPMNAMGTAVGDLNFDGLPDLAHSGIYEVALLESVRRDDGEPTWARTDAGRDLQLDAERGQEVAWGLDFGDVDNDGHLDLWVGYGFKTRYARDQASALYRRDGDRFVDVAPALGLDASGVTRGGLLVDVDRDGWLDLITRDLGGPARLWRARCGSEAWLLVQPRQDGPNAFAVGARVEVDVDGRTHTRWIRAGGHSLSSGGPAEAHFGLGAADRVDAVRVVWPDGAVSEALDVETRGRLAVRRGD